MLSNAPALTKGELRVLRTFREFLITPGQMLCFSGPQLAQAKASLTKLHEKKFLEKESVKGGYTLTRAGFKAMKECE